MELVDANFDKAELAFAGRQKVFPIDSRLPGAFLNQNHLVRRGLLARIYRGRLWSCVSIEV